MDTQQMIYSRWTPEQVEGFKQKMMLMFNQRQPQSIRREEVDITIRDLAEMGYEREKIKRELKDKEFGQILTYIDLILNNCYKGKKLGDLLNQIKELHGKDISTRFLQDMVKGRQTASSRVSFVLKQNDLKTKRCLRFYGHGAWKREVLKFIIPQEEFDAREARKEELRESVSCFNKDGFLKDLTPKKDEMEEEAKIEQDKTPCIKANCRMCHREMKYYIDKDIETNYWSNFCFTIASSSFTDIINGRKLCWRCENELNKEDDDEEEEIVIPKKPQVVAVIKKAEWDLDKAKEYIQGLGVLTSKHWFSPEDFCLRFRLDKKVVNNKQISEVIQDIYGELGTPTKVNNETCGYLVIEKA